MVNDAKARKVEYMARGSYTRDLKRWLTFRNYTHSEPRFRALLLTGERSDVQLALS